MIIRMIYKYEGGQTLSGIAQIRMIWKYECGQTLSGIAHELSFVASIVNTMVKDAACIKEHVKGTAKMKSMITEKHEEQ
jgi:hypothetical protein